MKRVVLDGLPLQVRSAGIAVYAETLTREMARQRPDTEFVLFGMSRLVLSALRLGPSGIGNHEPWPGNVRWVESGLYPLIMSFPLLSVPRITNAETATGAADVFHATNYVCPRTRGTVVVVTVYDLTLLRFPELGTRSLRRLVERTRLSVEAASRVIAISESTKRDLIELVGASPEKIRVVALGCDPRFQPLADETALNSVRQRFKLGRPYVLHVGTLEPRKNLTTLIRAYDRLRREHRLTHELVLAGEPGWMYQPTVRLVEELGLQNSVHFIGHVPVAQLPALYAAAELLVFPSLYEGFGLPPLEAMACGTPVVVSNVSSLPEVVGDAGLLVDPTNETALADGIFRGLTDTGLRRQMRERGLKRAKSFSWERCARETLAVYAEAIRVTG